MPARTETHFSFWDKYERSPLLKGGCVSENSLGVSTLQAAEPHWPYWLSKEGLQPAACWHPNYFHWHALLVIRAENFSVHQIPVLVRAVLLFETSRERPKSALYLRLKIVKEGPFGLCEILVGSGNSEKKLKWDFWTVSQCRKMLKGGPFGIFWHPLCCKIFEQTKGRPFGGIQKTSKKSGECRKKSEWKTPKVLCFWGSGRRCSCFGRGSGVSSIFWTSVVQVDDVEQMNKKVDRSRWTDQKN